MSGDDICAMLTAEELPSMVRELPREALRELAEEITALQASALQLGASKGTLQDATRKELRMTVSEIYSPPRVTRAARMLPHLGITPGFATSLSTMRTACHGTSTTHRRETERSGNYWWKSRIY